MFSSGGKAVAIASARRSVVVIPENGSGPYQKSQQQVIRIQLSPALGYLDTHESFLSFRIKPVGMDLTKPCRMDKSSLSWVKKLTIESSTGSKLEEIDDYNLLSCMLHEQTGGKEYTETIGTKVDSHGDRASRQAAMAHADGAQYNSGFDCSGLLGGETKVLPLPFLQGAVTISLELAPVDECFVYTKDATASHAEYQVCNLQYHASVLSMSEEYSAKMSEQVRTSGVDMSFVTYRTHRTNIRSNDEDLPISQNAASVRGTYHLLREAGKISSSTADSLSTYSSGDLRSIQWDMGGQLYPTQPIEMEKDGSTSMFTHNLQTWNMHRNHAIGSKVDATNFDSTESDIPPLGVKAGGYKARPIKRVYGTWVANNAAKVKEGGGLVPAGFTTESFIGPSPAPASKHFSTVLTLSFVPSDPRDVALITLGQRCKMGLDELPAAEDSDDSDAKVLAPSGDNTHYLVSDVDDANAGLSRVFKDSHAIAGTTNYTHSNSAHDSQSLLYAGAPEQIFWGYDNLAADQAGKYIGGLGVAFVDGKNNPIFSKVDAFGKDGWVDILPTDEQFYIANSFETHGSNAPDLVSGSDLTNATPLLLRLRYQKNEGQGNFFRAKAKEDTFTSFVAIDSVCRLQPDGLLISSV